MDEVLLILLAIVWAIGTPIIAIVALVRSSSLRDENRRLAAEFAALRRQLAEGGVAPLPPAFAEPAPAAPFEQPSLPTAAPEPAAATQELTAPPFEATPELLGEPLPTLV